MKVVSNLDKSEAVKHALGTLIDTISKLLTTQEFVTVGISGGQGVVGLFQHLCLKEIDIPWNRVHIFMVDERCVDVSHIDSNYKIAFDSFINGLNVAEKLPIDNCHPFLYDNAMANFGVDSYNEQLINLGGKLNILVMGMGEDGHIASLFPQHPSIRSEEELYISVSNSPKPPPTRISASYQLLKKADTALILAFGEKKRTAFANLNNNSLSTKDCPAKIINEIPNSYIFTDLDFKQE